MNALFFKKAGLTCMKIMKTLQNEVWGKCASYAKEVNLHGEEQYLNMHLPD